MSIETESIRNLALVGHAGAGKSSLFEALAVAAGALQTAGSVAQGNALSDDDPLEKEYGHSINSSIATLEHRGHRIHLIDTPGYADFRGPTLSALTAVETCAVVVNAARGIEHGAQRMMHYAGARKLPRMLVVNHIDGDGIDLARLVEQLRNQFGNECLPINLPGNHGTTVVDCFAGDQGEVDFSSVAEAHQQILDQVVEVNETIMEHFLEDGEAALGGQELHDAFEQCLREGHLVPICFVSALTGTGVRELLELVCSLLPSPAEGNPPPFRRGDGAAAKPFKVTPDPDAHVLADVFKIVNDPFVGKLSVFRVYQGTLRKNAQLFIDDARKPFKVGHLVRLTGKDNEPIEAAIPGDIAGVAKVDDIHFDAVLHDSHDEDHIHLEPLDFPQPVFGLAVVPSHKGQEQKLALALDKLSEEDPCFKIEHHKELNETVILGRSELHLKVMLERMQSRYGVKVETSAPRIAYRETISATAEGHHRHKKQTGGAGQFGEVFLKVAPLARGEGFQFVDEVKGGTIPGQFMPAVEKGVQQAMQLGAVAGYPIQDVRVVVHDGKHHPVDSKEIAFVTAGRKAFLDAIGKAKPRVLEPIVNVDVHIPEANVGDVTGSLASKRARIMGTDGDATGLVINAQMPLAELAGYQTELKSMTGGEGRYTIEPSHYEPVPGPVQDQLAQAWKQPEPE